MSLTNEIKELSDFLNEAYNSKSIVSSLESFFIKNYDVDDVSIFIYDSNTNSLRDFSKSWLIVEDKKSSVYDIWNRVKIHNCAIIDGENIYYPLKKYNKIIGFLKLNSGKIDAVKNLLDVVSYLISLKVQNVILSDKMQKNIDFHSSMKNIAKIIETQYEMNYIIPIIGEMIDKFVSEHLVYIFLKDEEENMNLIWPSSCNDEKILELVKIVEADSEYFMTGNKKVGIFPMSSEGKLIGAIVTKSVDSELHEKEIEYIEQLSNQAATTINRANVYSEILKHATLDALTNFYNRRQLEERIKQEVSSARRQRRPLCAIMCDIDYFKHVNDTYGHAVGDFVLKTVSAVIKKQLRDYDIAGRYGGEEFVLLLPFTELAAAEMVANRLKCAVEETIIDITKINPDAVENNISVTISLGVRELSELDTPELLIQNADNALYRAKETGRNKVVVNYDKNILEKM